MCVGRYEGMPQGTDADAVQVLKKVGRYLVGQQIGSGAFSTVHVGVNSETGERVAVKVCCKERFEKEGMLEDLTQEVKCMKKVRHDCVVNMKDDICTHNNRYLVMELCKETLLDEIMDESRFSEAKARERFYELMLGIQACHDAGIVHRDVKPDNVLITQDGKAKLSDFGFARHIYGDGKLSIGAGTSEYLAPECYEYFRKGVKEISPNDLDFFSLDIWAAGVVLFAMLTGRLPYSKQELFTATHRYPDFPANLSTQARGLILKMLHPNPAKRPSASEVLSHPWLSSERRNTKESVSARLNKKLRTVIGSLRSSFRAVSPP
eukprot:TRINITY_DN790_c0_g1_i1.p1 TRINITY_DN790_c0_g1~~TRINITY_DN790_c0_g1_i1.p1  ORF type:complete len:338 (+),score=65.41 TRINITY_DN790_c0_g1_i1:53-1015(+)